MRTTDSFEVDKDALYAGLVNFIMTPTYDALYAGLVNFIMTPTYAGTRVLYNDKIYQIRADGLYVDNQQVSRFAN